MGFASFLEFDGELSSLTVPRPPSRFSDRLALDDAIRHDAFQFPLGAFPAAHAFAAGVHLRRPLAAGLMQTVLHRKGARTATPIGASRYPVGG